STRLARTARKLTALRAKQTPTLDTAMTTPATDGPTTRAALKSAAFSATAFGSSSRPTIWKVSDWRPGLSKTIAAPLRNASTYASHGRAWPEKASAASAAETTIEDDCVTVTRRR